MSTFKFPTFQNYLKQQGRQFRRHQQKKKAVYNKPPLRSRRNRRRFTRPRMPRLRIMYGQQQDLAFGNNIPNSQRGVLNTFTTPVSESKMIKSYFKVTRDSITLCQPIPTYCYSNNLAVIPLHPQFYQGRLATMAATFLNFQIQKAVIHYVPLIGSTSTGMIAMASVQHCNPITATTNLQFGQITLLDAEINPVWMCSKHLVTDIDTTSKTMVPITRKDIPNQIYIVGSGLAGTLIASATLFLEMTIKLTRPSPNSEFDVTGTASYTISALGIQTTVATTLTRYGIVMTSTIANIDVGELVQIPAINVANTNYLVVFQHNSQVADYKNIDDQGTISINFFLVD